MPFFITKASGEKELFDIKKLSNSLKKAGASPIIVGSIIDEITHLRPQNTREIHDFAIQRLAQASRPIAARYNIKQALIELGPAGYPFEQYIARLLQADGYQTSTNQTINGQCVSHEIDVIAVKGSARYLVECKFHNNLGLKTDIKIPLYIQARFEDITNAERQNHDKITFTNAWIFSNTQFTLDAINYATCVNMNLTGWSYPESNNLAQLIDRYALHPITALTSISRSKKNILINHNIILCCEVPRDHNLLVHMGFNGHDADLIIAEASGVCTMKLQSEK